MNQTQGLGNASYSASHKKVIEKKDRLRVARQLFSLLSDYVDPKDFKNFKLLDVGCSAGDITAYFSKFAGKTVGVDVDKNAIRLAKERYANRKNLTFIVASASKLPFDNESFDIVLCNQVYSYVADPEKLMNEIYRVMKKGGICLFTGDNLLRPIEPLYNLPFIRLLPKNLTKQILKLLGYKKIYIGSYKTLWGIKKLLGRFELEDYTIKVLKNPKKYNFSNLIKYKNLIGRIPNWALYLMEPFFPTFIFILRKN